MDFSRCVVYGEILVIAQNRTLCAVDFEDFEGQMISLWQKCFGELRLEAVNDPGE